MSHSSGDLRGRSPIITNDDKDAIIARLVERSEWIMNQAQLTSSVIDRLDTTLDHVSEAVSKQASAIESIARQLNEQDELKRKVADLQLQLVGMKENNSFWAGVRDRIWWIGFASLSLAAGAGIGGVKVWEALASH